MNLIKYGITILITMVVTVMVTAIVISIATSYNGYNLDCREPALIAGLKNKDWSAATVELDQRVKTQFPLNVTTEDKLISTLSQQGFIVDIDHLDGDSGARYEISGLACATRFVIRWQISPNYKIKKISAFVGEAGCL